MPNAVRHLLIFFLSWSTLLLFWYFLGAFQPISVWASTIAALGLTLIVGSRPRRPKLYITLPAASDVQLFLLQAIPFFLILVTFLAARTRDEIHSPWQVLPVTVFPILLIGLALRLAFYGRFSSRAFAYTLDVLFIATLIGASVTIFAVGFGFDPFLHQAAVTALVQDGAIAPVTPLYALFYAIVGAIAMITQLNVVTVDQIIIPVLSILILGFGLRATWPGATTLRRRAFLLPALFILSFAFFTFSIPFHLATLLCIIHLSWRQAAFDHALDWRLHAGLLIASCFAHPIPGLPLLILFLGETVWRRYGDWRRVGLVVSATLVAAIALPAALLLTDRAIIIPDIAQGNLNGILLRCAALFADPYRVTYLPIPWSLELLYDLRRLATFIIPLALLALPTLPRDDRRYNVALLVANLLACFLLVQLSYANIISYEHFEFALRLLSFTGLAILVVVASSIGTTDHPIPPSGPTKRRRVVVGVILTPLVLTSWYFSYPAYDGKNYFTAPSVSAADLRTVRAIETDAHGEPYIVLSHQMLAAAALRQYGFRERTADDGQRLLWYPIPTGGPLYHFFTDYLAEPSNDIILHAGNYMNVARIYVVVHDSWPYAQEIREHMTATSGAVLHTNIEGRSVMVYTLHK